MNVQEIEEGFARLQRASGRLRAEPLANRKKRLIKLKDWIYSHRERLHQAAVADLNKPLVEFYGIEILYVLNEIRSALRNLDTWARHRKVPATLEMLGTRSRVMYEPKGTCLIISPWNYPFSLCIGPVVSAIAAGNNIMIKPSEHTPNISAMIGQMVSEVFDRDEAIVIQGAVAESNELLKLPFDHIFFTGSPEVGKVVMRAAAEHLTSVTLELGGKCPAVVTDKAQLDDAALRIAVSKYSNAGQTCVAPDYVLVQKEVAGSFTERLIKSIRERFLILESEAADYARIIHQKHFDRLLSMQQEALRDGATLLISGQHKKDSLLFYPTVLGNVSMDSRLMKEEIFGPILPVITYEKLDDALAIVQRLPKPLGLYVFSSSRKEQEHVLTTTSAGTACINECAIQFLHHKLPFGGTNYSGLGKAHDFSGFAAFSNEKPVLKQKRGFSSVQMLYPPATKFKQRFLEWLLWRL